MQALIKGLFQSGQSEFRYPGLAQTDFEILCELVQATMCLYREKKNGKPHNIVFQDLGNKV
jgi:hypothetical protein